MYIYKTTNLANGKIYVGQTRYKRKDYFGSGNLIRLALLKYGLEKFEKTYIEECHSQEELDQREIYWISKLKSQDHSIGYNIADGGWNCLTINEDIKTKISKTLKGKYVGKNAFRYGMKLTEEHKDAISKGNTGKKLSDETKKKLSEAHTGKKLSDETKKKLSEAHTGKKLSDEHKNKISESGKGRLWTEEQKNQLRMSNMNKTQAHSRTISATCIQTNIVKYFNNISEASRFFNSTRQRIVNNTIEGWLIIVNEPKVSIKKLKENAN